MTDKLKYTGERIQSLDFLRGIAAFGVMLFHFTIVTTIQIPSWNLLKIIGSYGHFGVIMFFTISGFVIPLSMQASMYSIKSFWIFLLKRTIRLEIPFLAIILIEVVLIFISSFTPWRSGLNERLDVYPLLLHVVYLNGILEQPWLLPVFWTLAIEFQFYLLMAILFPLVVHANTLVRTSTLALLLVLGFVLPQLTLFFTYGVYFILGIVTFQAITGTAKMGESLGSLAICFLITYYHNGFGSLLFAFFTVTIIVLLRDIKWKWSSFLGLISYSLYLVHVPFGGRLLALTQLLVVNENVKVVLIVVYTIATIFVAWLFYKIIEQPSMRLAGKLSYRG